MQKLETSITFLSKKEEFQKEFLNNGLELKGDLLLNKFENPIESAKTLV